MLRNRGNVGWRKVNELARQRMFGENKFSYDALYLVTNKAIALNVKDTTGL